jgi:Carbohydrate family 9 binding domain-like/PEP-CTERM motif
MKSSVLMSLAAVALLAGTSLGASYTVKYTAAIPTGPTDAAWNTATVIPSTYFVDGSIETTPGADLAVDVRYLWDGANLYGRIMVTDNVHANNTADGPANGGTAYTNQWNMDDVEFYVNGVNRSAAGGFAAGTTQDAWGINNLGHLNLSTTANGTSGTVANNNVKMWTDPAFDPTGAGGNGNYGIQEQWAWQGAAGNGGLGLSATPTAGQLLRLGGAANDSDYAGTRRNHEITGSYSGMGGITWNDPSTYGPALLGPTPEPATLTLLVLGGAAVALRRRAAQRRAGAQA